MGGVKKEGDISGRMGPSGMAAICSMMEFGAVHVYAARVHGLRLKRLMELHWSFYLVTRFCYSLLLSVTRISIEHRGKEMEVSDVEE